MARAARAHTTVFLWFAVQDKDADASIAFHKARANLKFAEEQHGGAGRCVRLRTLDLRMSSFAHVSGSARPACRDRCTAACAGVHPSLTNALRLLLFLLLLLQRLCEEHRVWRP